MGRFVTLLAPVGTGVKSVVPDARYSMVSFTPLMHSLPPVTPEGAAGMTETVAASLSAE